MLSRPEHGWTDFSLGGETYSLSYLTDIPAQWLDRAIIGLKNLEPFEVRGFCEPGQMVCFVSYRDCHILFRDNNRRKSSADLAAEEICQIGMLEFCKALYHDINADIDAWSRWQPVRGTDDTARKQIYESAKRQLETKLGVLRKLIEAKESCFKAPPTHGERFWCR